MRSALGLATAFLIVTTAVHGVYADDWPQWLGPQRDSVWREDGIVERFPEGGLEILWRTPIELGYAGPAVAGGKVFVTDFVRNTGDIKNNPGGRDELSGKERVLCLDARSGRELWKQEYDCNYAVSYPSGPRCTPTVDGDLVFTLGTEGNLLCLRATNGEIVWQKNLTEEYDTKTPIWGFAAHPLVDGDLLYCVVGGEGSVAVAFDKRTGREVWRKLTAPEPGYCPPTMIQHAGRKQLLIWDPIKINALNPANGELYWSIKLRPKYAMSITAPRKSGNLLFASGIGHEAAVIKLDDDQPTADVVWRGKTKMGVYCANSTPFVKDNVIYGVDCHTGALIAASLEDGKRHWETFDATTGTRRASHGTAFLVKHQDRFFLFNETGDLILARLTPAGYEELDRFHVLEPTGEAFGRDVVWSHPAFAGRCAFVRNDKEIVCVNLAAGQ